MARKVTRMKRPALEVLKPAPKPKIRLSLEHDNEIVVHIPFTVVHEWLEPVYKRPAEGSVDIALLTEREKQIFASVLKGKFYKEVAYELNITTRTVKLHAANIIRKLGLSSMKEALRFYGTK